MRCARTEPDSRTGTVSGPPGHADTAESPEFQPPTIKFQKKGCLCTARRLRFTRMYQLGLASVSFRALSPREIITAVRRAGLSCIEWGSDVHAPCTDEAALNEISALCRQEGIRCSSYGTYFRLGTDRTEALLPYIRAAKRLGTDILRVWCGNRSFSEYTKEELPPFLQVCREAAELAAAHRVTLCMECHHHTFTDSPEGALTLMHGVDSPAFRMYWQPNQYCTEEENLRYAKAIAPYTKHLHVFHWDSLHRYPLREGLAQWRRYLSAFSGDRTLLLEFMPDDLPESLPEEASALRALSGEEL